MGGALGLVVTAPLIPVIAAAVYIDSPGPIFFRQRRAGSLKSISTREGKSGVRTIYTMESAFYDPQGRRVCSLLLRTSEGQ